MSGQSRWLSFEQLLKRWEILGTEIVRYFRKGLQPYDKYFQPVPCPSYCHLYHHEYTRLGSVSRETKIKMLNMFSRITNNDPQAVSWKYVKFPASEEEKNKLMVLLKKTIYKKSDVEKIEKECCLVVKHLKNEMSKYEPSRPQKKAKDEEEKYVFRKEGDFWTVIYKGGEPIRLKDSIGLNHIAYLLRSPNSEFNVLELEYNIRKDLQRPINETYSQMPEAKLQEEEGLTSNIWGVVEKIIGKEVNNSREAISNLKQHLSDLRIKKESANELGDVEEAEKCESEIQKIEKWLVSTFGLYGQPRDPTSMSERARQRVTTAIRRSLKKIQKCNQDLWIHLYNSLFPLGKKLSYKPDREIHWKTD